MEEKKFDPYQFIGFILIALILTWMLYRNAPRETTTEEKPAIEQTDAMVPSVSDSLQRFQLSSAFGNFAKLISPAEETTIDLENEKMRIGIRSKGGIIQLLRLKEFNSYTNEPLNLIADKNSDFNITFTMADGRQLNTRDFYFVPSLEKGNDYQQLTLKASPAEGQFIAFVYTLPENGYLVSFRVQMQGLDALINAPTTPKLQWKMDTFRNSKSIDYENRYTELTYGYDGDRVDYLSLSGTDEEVVKSIRWISYRQHFFSAILIPESIIPETELFSKNLANDETLDEKFTKSFLTTFDLTGDTGNMNQGFKFYFGPTDYKTLRNIEGDLAVSVPLGWGIFGWINRFVFIPLFEFISSFLPHGIAIIVMTLIVRLAMSPVTYKSYVSQVKMKVLRPEIEEINAKHKDDAVKRQQETMSLYNRAGVNPMAGCIPALIQLPVFYALFTFFPAAFVLRQKRFLWADDLSSYDSIYELPFNIPFYGDHISLFPILASIAILIYTQMTMGQQSMPQQPGMPNMKFMMYLMPVMMLFFFNNYASGLSLYYFVSNLLTIFLMLAIKNYIIDDAKILAKIEENKKKPRKTSGFSARLQKAMEEAERQQKAKKRIKNR